MIKFPNMIKLLVVLAMVCSLVAIVAAPASAAAGIMVNPGQGTVGSPVAISAGGFAGLTPLSATFGGVPVATVPTTVTTDGGGGATFSIVVPARPYQTIPYVIQVTDGANTATGNFTMQPAVAITAPTSKQGPVGTAITVLGRGFTAGVTAFAMFESSTGNVTLGSALVDGSGYFQVTGTVPASGAGAKKVWGNDLGGPTPANTYGLATINNDFFTVIPTIAVSPTSGLAGTTVAVSGSGWTPSVNVTLSLGALPWTLLLADSYGALTGTPKIPTNAVQGVNQIAAVQGSLSASTTFTVVAAGLTLTPASGPKGTTVLITGNAFTKNETDNEIVLGNLTFAGLTWGTKTITIDTTGVMQPTSLPVPSGAAVGSNQVVAKDKYGVTAIATFIVTKPTIAINPTTGPKGSTVVVTGSGWAANRSVTIMLDGAPVQTVSPDSTGAIAATASIPIDAESGSHAFTADDGSVGNTAAAVTFTIPGPVIAVIPNSGVASTTVTVSGSGFGAYFPIELTMANIFQVGTVISNAMGGFSYTFNVPGLAPGVQVIKATDTVNTATTFFTITAAPISIGSQLAGISTQLVRVWGYFGGQWQMYDPGDATGSNLATMTAGRGYWINASEACTLIYGAYSYALSAGWNLIGWR